MFGTSPPIYQSPDSQTQAQGWGYDQPHSTPYGGVGFGLRGMGQSQGMGGIAGMASQPGMGMGMAFDRGVGQGFGQNYPMPLQSGLNGSNGFVVVACPLLPPLTSRSHRAYISFHYS